MIDNPLPSLIEEFGSESKLATAMGITQPAICKAKGLKQVSPKMAIRIETVTSGRLRRWQMRPDMWDPPKDANDVPPSDLPGTSATPLAVSAALGDAA